MPFYCRNTTWPVRCSKIVPHDFSSSIWPGPGVRCREYFKFYFWFSRFGVPMVAAASQPASTFSITSIYDADTANRPAPKYQHTKWGQHNPFLLLCAPHCHFILFFFHCVRRLPFARTTQYDSLVDDESEGHWEKPLTNEMDIEIIVFIRNSAYRDLTPRSSIILFFFFFLSFRSFLAFLHSFKRIWLFNSTGWF